MHDAIAYINYLLILASAMMALLFLGNKDSIAVYIFCFLSALYGLLEGYIPDELGTIAYVGSALTSLIIIHALSAYIKPTSIIVKIQSLCLCFIATNFLGWVAFMNYMEPVTYTVVCAVLYSWMIIIIGGHTNVIRINTMGSRNISIFSNSNKGSYIIQPNKKERRN